MGEGLSHWIGGASRVGVFFVNLGSGRRVNSRGTYSVHGGRTTGGWAPQLAGQLGCQPGASCVSLTAFGNAGDFADADLA
jgi:hypothetical protein